MWVSIILFTFSVSAQLDKHFESEKLCWNFYENHPLLYRQIDDSFHKVYPIRLYQNKKHGLVWLTCEKLKHMRGNDVSIFPLNIPLPTPTKK